MKFNLQEKTVITEGAELEFIVKDNTDRFSCVVLKESMTKEELVRALRRLAYNIERDNLFKT